MVEEPNVMMGSNITLQGIRRKRRIPELVR